MGLLDVFTGMANGPRGGADTQSRDTRGGPSPLTLGLLALLAYKAFKGNQPNAAPAQNSPNQIPTREASGAPGGGGLGDWLRGALGGNLGGSLGGGSGGGLTGGAAGSIISGGLSELIKQFQQSGHGDAARSWVGTGPNQNISESDLARAAGSGTIDQLARETGMSRDEVLQRLSRELPDSVDRLTPGGGIPTREGTGRPA